MRKHICGSLIGLLLLACAQPKGSDQASSGEVDVLRPLEVDPFWPKPLPNHWMLGEVAGVTVDANDHVWVLQRPKSLTARETGAAQDPPLSECCRPAPSVIEFDPEGNVVQAWGARDSTQRWFVTEHGIFVDHDNNVWVGGNNAKDEVIIKFSKDGVPLLQIGEWGVSKGSNDPTHLGGPADIAVDTDAGEVYVADGYRNKRVIVFDSNTGAYKRHWGGYGEKPVDSDLPAYDPKAPVLRSFRATHSVLLSRDGLLYVADRPNNRIQVFKKDGTFVQEGFLARQTLNTGAIWDFAFSPDSGQQYLYVADGMNMKVWVVRRSSLELIGPFGQGGRNAGQFGWLHNIAMDSKGNLFTAEVIPGSRVQRFTPAATPPDQ